ncbi:PAQR family membrane homeostasis protein TrhA [Marinobacter antarcticus]|uniref:PAQR family membrane homeostasis protein TrhA n=1 Tax=Marinobacter antarcticus TaxID=564117 RepID=UPI000B31B332
MRGTVGWTLFAIIWSLAVTGVVLKVIFANRFELARIGIYIAMGWLIAFAFSDLMANLSETALTLTVVGGIVYTAGVAFYLMDRIPYMHACLAPVCDRRQRPGSLLKCPDHSHQKAPGEQ